MEAAEPEKPAVVGSIIGKLSFSKRRPKQPLVVYLERVGGEKPFAIPAPRIIGQKNARFTPPFLVIVKGQTVVFDNNESDQIKHNVYLLGQEKKDLGVFANKKKREHCFQKTGEVEVFCSIHSMMDAKIFVSPNPYFSIMGPSETSFSITNVPPGKYVLRTYQKSKRFKEAEQLVTLNPGATEKATIEMER